MQYGDCDAVYCVKKAAMCGGMGVDVVVEVEVEVEVEGGGGGAAACV